MCLPPSEEFCSVWSHFGKIKDFSYHSIGFQKEGPFDLHQLCTEHPELSSLVYTDGSIDISIFTMFYS